MATNMLRTNQKKLYVVQTPNTEDWQTLTVLHEGVSIPMTALTRAGAQEMASEVQKAYPGIRLRIVDYYVSGYSEEREYYSGKEIPGIS